jgi:protein-S-isoprenylcysteine O-methyltransferase Ste14
MDRVENQDTSIQNGAIIQTSMKGFSRMSQSIDMEEYEALDPHDRLQYLADHLPAGSKVYLSFPKVEHKVLSATHSLGGFAKPKDGTMRQVIEFLVRVALLAFIWFIWWWALNAPLSNVMNLSIIVGGVLLVFPLAWLGRKILNRHQTISRVAWTTTFVHFALGFLFGVPIIRAVTTHQDWSGWVLPVPSEIGLALVIISGAAFLLTVVNLALKGFGAPFFIALTRKLAADWLYAWTRNPMVLAALAFLLSLGIWFQSVLFVLWVLILFAPALLVFEKVYEERELEIRFGTSYLEYKSRTPMLFPRRPKS